MLWGELLVDGHNRQGICRKLGLPFNTVQNTRFRTRARDAGRRPKPEGVDGRAAGVSPEVLVLHDRVAQPTAENETLKGQGAQLQAGLGR